MTEHRLVSTNHTVRTVAFLWCLVTIGLHLWERGAGASAWVLLVAQFVVYPHAVYLRATHSSHPNRAERDNLLLDSALLGAWCGQLGFPTWITFMLVGATTLNAVVNRGLRGVVYSLGCTAAGAAVGIAIGGLQYWPATAPLVTLLCFTGGLTYACLVGNVVYRQNRRLARVRDEVRQSEERYRLIAENAADLIAMVDQGGRWQYVSPSYSRLLDAEDLAMGVDAFKRLHPDDAERARIAVLRSTATGKPRDLALRLVDHNGRIRQLRTRIQAVQTDAQAAQVLLVSQDVTDLRESEERLLLAAHALEGMTEAIMITANDGTVVTVNRAFTEITGHAREDVLGENEASLRNALQPPEYYDEILAIVRQEGYWSGTTWSKRKNGSVYREWRSIRAVRDGAGAITHLVFVFYEVGAAKTGADGRAGAAEVP